MEAKSRDLLSDLPDDILLHHIISFLQVKDILRLRSLSRRFHKTLSITDIPSFCFSDDSSSHSCSCTHVSDLMINTVIKNRLHSLRISRISFSSSCNNEKHGDLHKQWIIRLFESFCVNELSLDYKGPSIFGRLPAISSIFRNLPKSQSLKVLKLNLNKTLCLVMLPCVKLVSLETLHIKSIKTHGSLDEWISQSFPSLKHVLLQRITIRSQKQDFTIQSSSLEDLTIIDLCCFKPVRIITPNLCTLDFFIHWPNPEHKNKFVLETSLPNLQSLTWVGYSHSYDEENVENFQVNTIPGALIMEESNLNILKQLFTAIRLARELHIDTKVLKHWLRIVHTTMGMIEDLSLISLENLSHLEIHVGHYIKVEECITFLERSSNLETLTLNGYPYEEIVGDYFSPYLKERSVEENFEEALRDCKDVQVRRTKGLKKVKIITREFNYTIVIVIGWLMKSCLDLEEMSLHYPYYFHTSMMRKGLQYLHSFERASPQPSSFYFLPNNNSASLYSSP